MGTLTVALAWPETVVAEAPNMPPNIMGIVPE